MDNEELVETLNDLVRINNDRIQGFKKSIEDNEDAQLNDLFRHMMVQSQQFRSELADHIVRLDGSAVDETTSTDLSSKVHRAWIDIKAAVTGKNRDTILSSVEFGENAAVEAYEDALDDEDLPAHIKTLLESHLSKLRASHDQMASLRH
ncbi:ferritin-like domain-containing protein [Tellurirhabdus rosea]|uniref:ferritin-like domain-containing protein n=1 Tax=Tellurirhabdus rosea TaxID=2674997 RepID=UPI0022527A61|nr:PA2169 family four-helix-bundle protein [Tellurirhabdus rosea]